MRYYLARRAALKWLETPSVYQLAKDELYELDADSFRFLKNCLSDDGCTGKDSAFIDYCMDEGLLTTEAVSVQRPALRQSPVPSLRYLELQITDRCNLRCKHCYIERTDHAELAPESIAALLQEFENMQGLRVLITGGEPLMHSRFTAINEMLPDYYLRKVLFTNGLLLTNKTVKSLKVDEIQISIDGLEQAHDALRGSGTHAQAMHAVHMAQDAGFDVSVSTMVHRANLADFDGMDSLFRGMGIKDWTVDVPCSTGQLEKHREFMINPQEGGPFLGYGYGSGLHASTQGFGCGFHLLAVLANGSISKCTFYQDAPVGSVKDGLAAAWSRMQPVRLKELACDCAYLEVCRGGCRYRAETLSGKGERDLYRCKLYGII